MGNKNNQVQKDYRNPDPNISTSYINNKNQPIQISPPQNQRILRENINTLNVQREQPLQIRESNLNQEIKNTTLNVAPANPVENIRTSAIKQTAPAQEIINTQDQQKTQKNIKISQSSIKLIQTNSLRSEMMKTAMKVQGFEGEEFRNRKVKKFNIEANIPEKDLIKEQDYFDESGDEIELRPKIDIKLLNFSMGSIEHITTFSVKTYLYDTALGDKLVV